jgi:lipoprotein-releasing system permease protein
LLGQKESPGEPSFKVGGFPERIGGFVGIGVVAEPDEKTDEYDFAAVEKMVGRRVVLTTGSVIEQEASSNGTGERFKRRAIQFTIVDIVRTGVYHLDKNLVYLPIEELQNELYPNEKGLLADQIQIKISSDTDLESALAQIRGLWQVFADEQLGWDARLIRLVDIQTAKGMHRRYVVELRKQMGILLLIFGVVSVSAVVLIFCIFYMIVRLKQRDIAIIKSCGAASSSAAFIFLAFGFCVGIVGSGIGAVLACIITKNINVIEKWISVIFGLKLWKSSVYMFSEIPNQVNWGWALPIVLFAVLAATIGALIPAIVAARTRPVEILRYE